MVNKKYLYAQGVSYRGFFVCPIEYQHGYTYRCFCPQNGPSIQLGSGIFLSIAEAIDAGKKYLDREWQYRYELSHYQQLLETGAITQDEYYNSACSVDQAIWGLL